MQTSIFITTKDTKNTKVLGEINRINKMPQRVTENHRGNLFNRRLTQIFTDFLTLKTQETQRYN
jgi:hypothetical protein